MSGSKYERNGSIMGEGIYTTPDIHVYYLYLQTARYFSSGGPYFWENSIFLKPNKKEFPYLVVCECEIIKDDKKVNLKTENLKATVLLNIFYS